MQLSGEKIEVKTNTIYGLVKNRNINLIRMDVEGHEVSILKSLCEYISFTKNMPMVLFEPHLSRYSKENDIISPMNELFKFGYKAKYIGSSWENGSNIIEKKGYKSINRLKTDGVERKIFEDISNEDLINLITKEGGIRTVLLKAN